jgi:hypothetical protein
MCGISTDITGNKRAELELQQQRDELAHFARVMTLSELSGSLAHELNQPLAIIFTNAQAAQRLLAQQPPDLAEAREILADIVSEDERAGDVIKRLRALLKPGQTQLQPISANALVEDVLRIARSDLIERGIKVHAELDGSVPPVVGDRVQLQQVLLNLILNAGDAMAANPPPGPASHPCDGPPRWHGAGFSLRHRLRPAAGRGTRFRAFLHYQERRTRAGLAPLETLTGILMCGVSTGLFFALVSRWITNWVQRKTAPEPQRPAPSNQ